MRTNRLGEERIEGRSAVGFCEEKGADV